MSDALKAAISIFVDDFEAARDIFIAAAESAVSGPGDEIGDAVDELLEDAEESSKDGFVIVEREAIEALRNAPYDVSSDLEDALKDLNWSFQKAVRELRHALMQIREGASA